MAGSPLTGLFDPDRVAVVGATEREGSIGAALLANLEPFDGEVVPVNPNAETVGGRPCYPSLVEVPDPVDLAVVAVPPEPAVEAVRSAGEAGVPNVVVITAGFAETGSEGAALETALREAAEAHDINLVGPNSLGVISTPSRLNAAFGPDAPLPGSISLLSQSGAFVTATIDWALDQGLGFKDVVSLGNKAVLDETDFVRAWGEDDGTDVVAGYVESVVDGRSFIDVAREVTAETPVVLVKSGRTSAGAKAASSHTGALAGSERAYEAGLAQAGVIRAANVQELFDAARALSGLPLPDGDGVAVVTNAGGPGVLATDAVGDAGLELASLAPETVDRLGEVLPAGATRYNPVDVIGDADVDRFTGALDAVLDDDGVDAAVVIAAPTAVLDYDALADRLAERRVASELPLVVCLMGGERARRAGDRLGEVGVPTYFDPARAVGALEVLARYREIRTREYGSPSTFDVDRDRARAVLERVRDRESNRLGVEAMELLDAYGIETPAAGIASDPADARRIAAEILGDGDGAEASEPAVDGVGSEDEDRRDVAAPPSTDGGDDGSEDPDEVANGVDSVDADKVANGVDSMDADDFADADAPGDTGERDGVVMKIVSPDIVHKSDIGGVAVDVPIAEVAETYEELIARARHYQPDAAVIGVQVQEQVDVDAGTETIVGANRDPQFGPLVLFGLGGVFVEVMEDTAVRVAPISDREAGEMVDELRAAPLLRGARGRESADRGAIVETLQRLSQLVTEFPAILELDVNPLLATPDGVTALDLRLTVDREEL